MFFSFLFIAAFPNATTKLKRINPYSTLGLKKTATEADIIRAFKRFSEFKNSTKNPSKKLKEQMREIEESYHMISDNSTRAIFDKYGHNIFSINNFSVYDYLSDNEVNVIRSYIPDRAIEAKRNGGVVVFPVLFSLKDFIRGKSKSINIFRIVPCACSRGGNRCNKCKRTPTMSMYQNYKLTLPKGSSPLQRIFARNITDSHKERSATDVIFVAYQKPNKQFKRVGYNIYSNITVSLADTFSTKNYKFTNADDRIIEFSLSNVRNGDVITVPGKGVPFPDGHNKSGDLILTVRVVFPKKLSKEQKDKIRNILPDDESAYE